MTTPPAGLRVMKRRATGLLIVAALVFVGTYALGESTWVGYVRAAAEAGMIGGLADWFAVTALFRHPLGLRVPHTALIPRQKDALATKLGEFVQGNFLTAVAVEGQLREARVVHRAAAQLATPVTSRAVARELSDLVGAALAALSEQRLTAYVLQLARRDLERRSYAPVLGGFLARALQARVQRPLVDVALARARGLLETRGDELAPHLKRLLEVHWASILVDTGKLSRRLIDAGAQILREAERDPAHTLRTGLDAMLEQVVADLRYSPRTSRDVDARLRALLADERVAELLRELLADLRTSLATGVREQDLTELVVALAGRVTVDAELERRLEDGLLGAVRYAVEHYGGTAVLLIQRTVAGWEARDASTRIEAAVGRDLQFIRINGTVVGALAGVCLQAAGQLLG